MRAVAVPLVVFSILLVPMPGDVACAQVTVNGSITRIDAGTWRLRCGFHWTGPSRESLERALQPPPPDCTYNYVIAGYDGFIVSLEGPFGTPANLLYPDWVFPEPNGVVWLLASEDWADELGFDFTVADSLSQLVLDYSTVREWDIEVYACWDAPDPCPEPCSGGVWAGRCCLYREDLHGRLYADLPQTVGDSAPLRKTPPQIYVDAGATGANTGTSWTNAFTDLQSALAVAVSGEEIWVAAGTYKPTTGTDRTATFRLKSGVGLYGGFAGTETSRAERDWESNVTTLSGDIGIEYPQRNCQYDNVRHVVTSNRTDSTAVLDGFVVKGGWGDYFGGGMINTDGSLRVSNVTFTNNQAEFGGGMCSRSGNPVLTNVVFSNNAAYSGGPSGGGGGMADYGNATLINVAFYHNYSFRCNFQTDTPASRLLGSGVTLFGSLTTFL